MPDMRNPVWRPQVVQGQRFSIQQRDVFCSEYWQGLHTCPQPLACRPSNQPSQNHICDASHHWGWPGTQWLWSPYQQTATPGQHTTAMAVTPKDPSEVVHSSATQLTVLHQLVFLPLLSASLCMALLTCQQNAWSGASNVPSSRSSSTTQTR